MIRRRSFITLLGGAAAAWPVAARAQQGERVRRVGILMSLGEDDPEGKARIDALKQGLREFGWIEGRNLQIVLRSGGGIPERLHLAAIELVSLKPDVIFASPTSSLAVLQRETRSVPIVFAQVADPVGGGFVASLARPGSNATGFATIEFGSSTKWVELLKEVAPQVSRLVIIFDPANTGAKGYLQGIEAAANALGNMQVVAHAVHDSGEIKRTITAYRGQQNGLIAIPGPLIAKHRDLIVSLANQYQLPNVSAYRFFPKSGGLASYGADNINSHRLAASYVSRILHGEKPADLPVQMASKFELVINLATAKAMGLTVPPKLLFTADEVIE